MSSNQLEQQNSQSFQEEYTLIPSPPPLETYLHLRITTGLTPKSPAQAGPALSNSWHFIHLVHNPTQQIVAMGRLLGDGGWYFHVADMAVLPAHQRKGLGDWILRELVEEVKRRAPDGGKGALVNLIADKPAVGFYERSGFVAEGGKGPVGMIKWVD